MKNFLLKAIYLAAVAFFSLPIAANDYLKIYFKDGHTERHYMKLVESISTTRYDLEGTLHSDYQMQQIIMKDTTYSYYIADIDSMAFTKVYEEQVKKDVEKVTSSIIPIFEQCFTIEEMEKHIDEIKHIEGVEDVKRSGTDIIVKVRNWHDMVFMYPEVPEDNNNSLARLIKSINPQDIKRIQKQKKDGTPIKVAIAFQMVNDTRSHFKDQGNCLRELRDKFEEMGFHAVFIPSKEGGNFDLDFYRRRMFDYDIVILDTHGGYNEESGIHGFLTDEQYIGGAADLWLWNKLGLPSLTDIDDTYISSCWTGYLSTGIFRAVTQNFIKNSVYEFGEGPQIVFNGACNSLNGKGTIERKYDGKTFSGGDAVAQIFHRKGADIYMGYNNSCKYSGYAAYNYLNYMLHGYSHEAAFDHIPDYQKTENSEWNASLIDLTTSDSASTLFLINTHTVEKTDQEIIEEYKNNKQLVLEGTTSCWDVKNSGLDIGFKISTIPNVDSTNGNDLISHNAHYSGKGNKEVTFSAVFKPEPGTTYYYRAATHDGFHFNWGEERSFMIPEEIADLTLSNSGPINLEVGESTTVEITAGSGEYGVTNLNSDKAKATLQGTTITIEALAVGDAKIVVTDMKTGQKIIIEVTVTQGTTYPDIALSTQEVYLNVGDTEQIEVTSGSGSYSIWVYAPEVANVTISGKIITIKALSLGSTIVKVTDEVTKKTTTFGIAVIPPSAYDKYAVDLGLSVKWSQINVGAVSVEDWGEHYAWGETESKSYFSWSSYDLCNGTESTITKYNSHDGKTILEPSDDAATVVMGRNWRTPTLTEMEELVNRCKWTQETLNGVKGMRVTGPNGNSIFLPFGGQMSEDVLHHSDTTGYYYVSNLSSDGEKYAPALVCYGNKQEFVPHARFFGLSIRPVFNKK